MIALNYVHFITFFVIFIFFVVGIYKALHQTKTSIKTSMIFAVSLIAVALTVLSVFVVDKYTKKAQISKLENKRLLSIEKIVYTGIVQNTGSFPIKKVTLEIKLVNRGHATGSLKGENYYKSTGLMDFLNNGMGINRDKPQIIVQKFVVAENLAAGKSKQFRVYFDYPPYFKSVSDFVKVIAH